MAHTIAQIPLPLLLLDDKNPRLRANSDPRSQLEILRELVLSDEYADKVTALARDIVNYGLDPSSLICVCKRDSHARQYFVLEGNRRVAALKLLLNPEMIAGLASNNHYRDIKKLSLAFDMPSAISCIVFDSEEQADHWVALKHTGQHGGAGMVPWGATETLRFAHRNSEKPVELQLLDFAIRFVPDFDANIIKITNLERLVSDPAVRSALGIEIIDSIVHVNQALPKFAVVLAAFLHTITATGFTVNDIKTKLDRQKFIKHFAQEYSPRSIDLVDATEIYYPLNGEGSIRNPRKLNYKAAKVVVRTTLHKSVLIPIASDQRYSEKTKALAKELKEFGFEKNPISSVLLIRAFLENVVNESGVIKSKNTNLRNAIRSIAVMAAKDDFTYATNIMLESPIFSKKLLDDMLKMPRTDRIDYMNGIVNALSIAVGYLNKIDKTFIRDTI
jgi:hypothetical protein